MPSYGEDNFAIQMYSEQPLPVVFAVRVNPFEVFAGDDEERAGQNTPRAHLMQEALQGLTIFYYRDEDHTGTCFPETPPGPFDRAYYHQFAINKKGKVTRWFKRDAPCQLLWLTPLQVRRNFI